MTRPATGDASWNRIKQLFQQAVDLEPPAREAFLNQACGDDGTLRREVESLLMAHRDAGDFAARPAIEVLADSTAANREYQILSALGAGGMGEVFRARDVTLGRDVAIKILPPIFAIDPDRLARFDREARLLASLNHPNICAIHGITDIDGAPGLVLELVDGETLAERIAAAATGRRRAVPSGDGAAPRTMAVSDALAIGRDIARALEAAHDKGIIHRDLKPANIKITPDAIVKVLDFGLAKATAESAVEPGAVHAGSVTVGASQDGVLLGTAAYMSPEQARGEPLDKRTDIWSFGCVLYEMLTGRRVANGATVSETITQVLEGEPDWDAMPATIPPSIHRLVRRCLEKDVRRRLKDIGDARLEIEDALTPSGAGTPRRADSGGAQPSSSRRHWLWTLSATMIVGTVLILIWSRLGAPPGPRQELRRVSAELGTDASLVLFQYGQGSATVLSPDATLLAFVAQPNPGAARQLYVRRLDELRALPLSGTDGALNPFFSPDSRWIGFFADGRLQKIPATGGGAVTICAVPNNRGGAWGEDGTIVFSPDRSAASLWHVSSSGGEAKPLIQLGEGETTQRWPQILQGGSAVLFTGNDRADGFDGANVVVQSLPAGPRKILVRGAYHGRYLPSGHLVYVHDATLYAAPFDVQRLELTGPAVPALEGATVYMPVGAAEIAMSDTGTVAYLPAPPDANYMAAPIDWMDRDGTWSPLRTMRARWLSPSFSPDGQRIAFDIFDGTQHDVWIYEWARDAMSRLTLDPSDDAGPLWTPDGRRIVFNSTRHGSPPSLYWQRVDGTGDVQRLTESEHPQVPAAWHPGGRILAFTETERQTFAATLMTIRLDGDEASGWRPGQPTVLMKDATSPAFSPDGRWLAYESKEAGRERLQVYVQAFPGPGGRWQISTEGGETPVWSATQPELFYGTPDRQIMSVAYSVDGSSFHAEKAQPLPNSRFSPRVVNRSFVLHPDGKRFALARAPAIDTAKRDHVTLIFNFFDELRRIAPPVN